MNYILDKNDRTIEKGDEVVITNRKGKRILANIQEITDSGNVSLLLTESGKTTTYSKDVLKKYMELNQLHEHLTDSDLVSTSPLLKQVFTEIMTEETAPVKPEISVDNLSKIGFNVSNTLNESQRKSSELTMVKSAMQNISDVLNKYPELDELNNDLRKGIRLIESNNGIVQSLLIN